MKKPITLLSVLSIVLAALALVIAIVSLTILWEPVSFLFSHSEAVVEAGPVIPLGRMSFVIGSLVAILIACFFVNSGKSIVGEVVAVILLSITVPALAEGLSWLQSTLLSQYSGTDTFIALSVANSALILSNGLSDIASSLCLLVCGMSIFRKKFQKEGNPV